MKSLFDLCGYVFLLIFPRLVKLITVFSQKKEQERYAFVAYQNFGQ